LSKTPFIRPYESRDGKPDEKTPDENRAEAPKTSRKKRPDRTKRVLFGSLLVSVCLITVSPGVVFAQTSDGGDSASTVKNPDPWQGLNRKIFGFNKFLDRWILKPVAKTYDWVLPDPLQRGVGNVFDNLLTPWVAANQFMQGKPRHGLSDLARFGLNTTLGLAGVFDVASHGGIRKHEEDFGQTLVVWGVPLGPYIMIPVLGPSTATMAAGRVADSYANPIRYIDDVPTRNAVLALYIINQRAQLLEAESLVSGDEYLFIRDAYLQRRQFLIDDGKVEEDPFLDEEFDFDE
jgi:phospholipid-binding lipoprotein MlaA